VGIVPETGCITRFAGAAVAGIAAWWVSGRLAQGVVVWSGDFVPRRTTDSASEAS
jgi:hypothetical protein